MKIIGIGNAIVDVICKVEESFLKNNSLTKSTMKLVDESELKNYFQTLKLKKQFLVVQLLILSWVFLSWEIM